MELPEGVTITRIHPAELGTVEDKERIFVLHPGGSVPKIGIEIRNSRGARRLVQVDPITGAPQVSVPDEQSP
jgi:hypothetical protein